MFYLGKLDLSNIPVPNDDERNQLFEEGLKLDKEGKSNEALKYYLKCLVGLKENSKFALLPQCLRNVSSFTVHVYHIASYKGPRSVHFTSPENGIS